MSDAPKTAAEKQLDDMHAQLRALLSETPLSDEVARLQIALRDFMGWAEHEES